MWKECLLIIYQGIDLCRNQRLVLIKSFLSAKNEEIYLKNIFGFIHPQNFTKTRCCFLPKEIYLKLFLTHKKV